MTLSNGNIFRVTGPLCGEFTGDRWIPRTKASDAELWCFLWSAPWISGWVNNREAGELGRQRAHYDVIVMHVVCGTDYSTGRGNSNGFTKMFCVMKYLIYRSNTFTMPCENIMGQNPEIWFSFSSIKMSAKCQRIIWHIGRHGAVRLITKGTHYQTPPIPIFSIVQSVLIDWAERTHWSGHPF